jgi:hypothetical protein
MFCKEIDEVLRDSVGRGYEDADMLFLICCV